MWLIQIYVDETVIYCCGFSFELVLKHLQSAFNIFQHNLLQQKLVLSVSKTKLRHIRNSKMRPGMISAVVALDGITHSLTKKKMRFKYLKS